MTTKRENVIVLGGGLEQRTNTRTGRVRHSIQIKADPITINLDPKTLGAPVAQAIAHHLRERVKSISSTVKPATLRARQALKRAFERGEPWTVKQFSGGRTGTTPPTDSDKEFNFSGRFGDGITATASKDGAWRINVPANRLDPRTAGTAGVLRIWTRLVELVPEFADMNKLMAASDIVRARIKAQERMFAKGILKEVVGFVEDVVDVAQNARSMFGT